MPQSLLSLTESDVIRYRLFGRDVILLNSFEVATDLLDKRSLIYSDRYASPLKLN